METLIRRYRGRLVDATGDNLLARFDSVLDAVNAAAEMQRTSRNANAELPYHQEDGVPHGGGLRGCDGGRRPDLRDGSEHRRPTPGFGAEGGGSASPAWCMTPSGQSRISEYEDLGEQTLKKHR